MLPRRAAIMALQHREHQGAPLPAKSAPFNSLLQREKVASERETDEVSMLQGIIAALYGENGVMPRLLIHRNRSNKFSLRSPFPRKGRLM